MDNKDNNDNKITERKEAIILGSFWVKGNEFTLLIEKERYLKILEERKNKKKSK